MNYITVKKYSVQLFFIFLVILSASNVKAIDDNKRVLLISSYHPGFPTFFQQINGVKSILDTCQFELDIEFMDSKRFYTDTNLTLFQKAIAYKLHNSKPYHLVITTDDNALNFVIETQHELFKNIPIVFCGVNDISLATAQNNNPNITGIVEAVSMKETIDLMIHLNPEANSIYAIADKTSSGQGDLTTYYNSSEEYPNTNFRDISLTHLSFDELKDSLSMLSPSSPVLLLSAYYDKNNIALDFDESLELITSSLNSQLYHLWYHGLGNGIFGGKLISHFEQGRSAAILAYKILNGAPISEISVIKESPNKIFFDYNLLEKHGINKKNLPKDCTIINTPETFYSRYKHIIYGTISAFAILVIFILILLKNIYKRHKIEVLLRTTKAKQEAMISNISDVIAIIDANGIVQYKSKNIKDLFGWQPSELINQHSLETVHPDDLERVKNEFHFLLKSNYNKVSIEYKYLCKNGEYKSIHLTANNLLNNPDIKGILLNYHDITERKIAELNLLNLNEEYLALNEELNESIERVQNINIQLEKAKEKAVESDQLKSSFLANLSHEIRTPMNGILGFTDLLRNPQLSESKRDNYINTIHKSGKYLLSVITDIIEISKIETQQESIKLSSIELHSFVLDIFNSMLVTIDEGKNLELKLKQSMAHNKTPFLTDEVKLRQIISNLISNAIKFTEEGSVCVSYLLKDNTIEFEVKDTGIGIDKNNFELIFNRFRQVEGETTIKNGGSGLGLAISKAYVEMMGGSISVESELGKGSTFRFFIPFKPATTNNKSGDILVQPENNILSKKLQILIAEDDDVNYLFLEELFSESNFQIYRAQNGLEAVKLCSKYDFNLVLMDIKMPIMDGYKAFEQIKNAHPHLPVIAQTAYALSEDEIKLKLAGFHGTISKPIVKEKLFELIETLISN